VKYTDWALGHFIDEAKKHAWFDDTLFVLTADHGANARGTVEIPVAQYRIPLFFYAPRHIAPGRVDRLMSQIDIAPTLGLPEEAIRGEAIAWYQAATDACRRGQLANDGANKVAPSAGMIRVKDSGARRE
jgi:arylsulfatase A-like enzyme